MIWIYEVPRFGGLFLMVKNGRMIKKRYKMGLQSMMTMRRIHENRRMFGM